MVIELTIKRKEQIKNIVSRVLKQKVFKLGELMSLIGILVAACPVVKAGWIYYKEFEKLKWLQGPLKLCDRKNKITLTKLATVDLSWWNQHIPINGTQYYSNF